MDTPAEPIPDTPSDEPEVLAPPVDSVLSWWGPTPSASDQAQLDATDCDLVAFAIEIGLHDEQLLEFANANQPRRRYLLCEQLSLTNWAGVYGAVDLLADRLVVLKISRRRTEPEGRHIARTSHPNVVTLYDMFVHEGYPTMVIEWCMQGNLVGYAAIAKSWQQVLARGLEAGRGLLHSHELGLVHGDIKPQNILLAREVGKLADFGIARGETMTGQPWGSRGYAPPERALGVWTFAGDVYSFARTLEDSLELRHPPTAVSALLMTAMVEDPEQRPTLPSLLDDLSRVLEADAAEGRARAREQERVRQKQARVRREQARVRREQERGRQEQERVRQSLDHARRSFEKRRQKVFLQTAVVAMLAIVGLGSVGLVAQCRVAPKVERRQPSIERAIELADAGDTMGAWLEYYDVDKHASVSLSHADLILLAHSLLRVAKRSTDSTREPFDETVLPGWLSASIDTVSNTGSDQATIASMAETTARHAHRLALQNDDTRAAGTAVQIRDEAHALTHRN